VIEQMLALASTSSTAFSSKSRVRAIGASPELNQKRVRVFEVPDFHGAKSLSKNAL
jgi:hypothetical protein